MFNYYSAYGVSDTNTNLIKQKNNYLPFSIYTTEHETNIVLFFYIHVSALSFFAGSFGLSMLNTKRNLPNLM